MGLIISPTSDQSLVTTDVTTNDVSTSKHGFAPKLDNNVFDFLSGTGTYVQPIDYSRRVYALLGGSILAEPPGMSVNSILGTAVTLVDNAAIFVCVYLPQAATITGVKWFQAAQGSYTADNNNVVGLYSYSGGTMTQVAVSANDGNIWKASANTWSSKAFTGTYAAAAGVYFIGILYNNSAQVTAPTIGGTNQSINLGVNTVDFTNSAKLRSSLTGQNNLPSPSQAMSGTTATALNPYVALY